ncbi:hypothetical protein RZS08_50025, partial [Arthrospira platensis SPKY1]|nr:hypothetical protein [Arthrospira platensis SPKY1]
MSANDFAAGQIWPAMAIKEVRKAKSPNGKGERLVIVLEGAPKPWMCSSNVTIRQIGQALGVREIEKTWVGAKLVLTIVPNVRRPDGTIGNAFRVGKIIPAAKAAEGG